MRSFSLLKFSVMEVGAREGESAHSSCSCLCDLYTKFISDIVNLLKFPCMWGESVHYSTNLVKPEYLIV